MRMLDRIPECGDGAHGSVSNVPVDVALQRPKLPYGVSVTKLLHEFAGPDPMARDWVLQPPQEERPPRACGRVGCQDPAGGLCDFIRSIGAVNLKHGRKV